MLKSTENHKNKTDINFRNLTKILLLTLLVLISFNGIRLIGLLDNDVIQNFSATFFSIFLEALPFILLGSFISALIEIYISPEILNRLLPRNRFLGVLGASLLGFIFPVCECAVVPITRGLIKKGMPISIAVTFMLAVPIVNPIVLLSTIYAFYGKAYMVLIRAVLGASIAIATGLLVENSVKSAKPIDILKESYNYNCNCGFDHSHRKYPFRILEALDHTLSEFYDILKYLTLGAMISAAFQSFIPRSLVNSFGSHNVVSVIFMMCFAFIISLCSEADAFVGRTFLNSFTTGSVATFLLLGPMLDIKNSMMLFGSFKKSFVNKLILYIVCLCLITGITINIIIGFR